MNFIFLEKRTKIKLTDRRAAANRGQSGFDFALSLGVEWLGTAGGG